jgi:hypothetical protein
MMKSLARQKGLTMKSTQTRVWISVLRIAVLASLTLFLYHDRAVSSTDADQAAAVAVSYLGLGEDKNRTQTAATSAEQVSFDGSIIQCTDSYVGKPTWAVSVSNVQMSWVDGLRRDIEGADQTMLMDFEVFVDVESGVVIKTTARPSLHGSTEYQIPFEEHWGQDPSNLAVETTISGDVPSGGLLVAISQRAAQSPLIAQEIEAVLISMEWKGEGDKPDLYPDDSIPVWWIAFRYADVGHMTGSADGTSTVFGTRQFFQIIDLSCDDPRLTAVVNTGSFAQ